MSGISEFCAQFTDEIIPAIRIGADYFYDPQELSKQIKEISSAGIYLGTEKRYFKPSCGLITLLAERTDKCVVVEDKSAWLFVCGKDILMQGVVEGEEFEPDELVIVLNEQDEPIGYGKIEDHHTLRKHGRAYVKNLLDLGMFLRREN